MNNRNSYTANSASDNQSTNSSLELYNLIKKQLIQAQALAYVGAQCRLATLNEELMEAYFEALWDLLIEAHTAFENLHGRMSQQPDGH